MLSKAEVGAITKSNLEAALDYHGTLTKKREKLLNYYNCQPYGDEREGQSSVVTSDVADVVEWMLPTLLRTFTQGKVIAQFDGNRAEDEEEADEKTFLSNYAFLHENDGVLILHDMFKDALLQYTGVVKVYWEESETTEATKYLGLSQLEYQKLLMDDDVTIESLEVEQDSDEGVVYNAKTVKVKKECGVRYANIPPEEFLIAKSARNFIKPSFIGHRSPKTRSELIEMNFDKDLVNSLSSDDDYSGSTVKNARYKDYDWLQDDNPSKQSANDIIYLTECYQAIDVNGDGIVEYWQVMYAGNTVLSMEEVDDHPFAVCVPIPIPHRAIGSCPAEQAADIQFRKSTLVRQMLNNVYQSNYPRVLHSNKVDLDDLLTPRAGGTIGVDSDAPDVAGHAQVLQVPAMIEGIMAAIEYTDTEREIRTGVTRYSQGLDLDALNKTATAFEGMTDASQQRVDLVARIFADGGVKQIFLKTVKILGKYQDESKTIKIMGKTLDINPSNWSKNINCRIDVGLGSGERKEKISNLNTILNMQTAFIQQGMVLSDQTKIYNTLDKLVTEVGLKDVSRYFNNPEQPNEVLAAQNQQLMQMVQQLQDQIQQIGDPLSNAETIRAQARLLGEQNKREIEQARMDQEDRHFAATMAKDLTKIEVDSHKNIPGALV